MERIVLKEEILDRIRTDGILFGKVAFALDVMPSTMPRIIQKNASKLTQIGVLKIIAEHLGVQSTDILLEKQMSGSNEKKPVRA
jgi:uncharacterized membrane protein